MTQKELKKYLHYNLKTGIFTWTENATKESKIGKIAGFKSNHGYTIISLKSKDYLAHRLAWIYVYGEISNLHIDHINHMRTDNRIKNLRLVERQENSKNCSLYSNNSTGVSGVTWNEASKSWCVNIGVKGTKVYLGSFIKFSEAVDARKNAEVLYGYHENHGEVK